MKVLHIVESAYRATLEEQDDTVLWLVQVLRGAGAELAVLLQGTAVGYAAAAQDASGINFGAWKQTRPPSIAGSVSALVREGVMVYGIEEDFAERGIREDRCISGVRRVPRAQLAALLQRFDQIWQW